MIYLTLGPSPKTGEGRKDMYLNNDPRGKNLRREVRKNATSCEKKVWELVRNRKLAGFKFRRNSQIGRYYVDFYCPEKMLVLEVDGPIHDEPEQVEYDKARDAYLKSRNLTILHIKNEDIESNINDVLENIHLYLVTN